ncbi:MAG: polysaccharide biosynthesis protein [Candidatus Omnitrophica bacterium]|nr:polysaccharide biosynthesis protein [Candidatus Omnitrophota bacterium]MBU2266425.1 polysaccharide biosynthesis protein [Candidatus Omnitrophota bacterium]
MVEKYIVFRYRLLQVAIDSLLVFFSLYGSYVLTEQALYIPNQYRLWFFKTLILMLVVRLTVNSLLGVYRQIWRHVSLEDIINIFKAVSLSTFTAVLVIFLFQGSVINWAIFLVDALLCFSLFSGARLLRRYLILKTVKQKSKFIKKAKVLLYGAGEGGDIFIRQIIREPYSKILIEGIIDDDSRKQGAILHGLKVLGDRSKVIDIIDHKQIDEVIITIPSATKQLIEGIYKVLQQRNVKIRTVPSLYEILSERRKLTNIRDIEINDLLGREAMSVSFEFLDKAIRGKKFLITGGAGSIGKELVKQITHFSPEKVVVLDINENAIFWLSYELSQLTKKDKYSLLICDIKNKEKLDKIIEKERPDFIFHAAAHKHVPISEFNPSETVLANVLCTKNLIEIVKAKKFIKKFCFISTDKAVKPSSLMGATKAIGEILILNEANLNKDKRFCFVRFGNVLGSRGSVIPLFKEMIESGGPIRVTSPYSERYFMGIQEAINLILQVSFMSSETNAFLLDMGDPIKIVDLAKLLINIFGFNDKSIGIEYIGLRPGEKLKEELYDRDHEKLANSPHKKIFAIILNKNEYGLKADDLAINNLIKNASRHNEDEVIKKLKQMFPTLTR